MTSCQEYILIGRAREINWRYMDCTKKQKYSWRTTTQWYIHTHAHTPQPSDIHTYAHMHIHTTHNVIHVRARLADLVHTNPRSIVDTAYSEQWWVRVTRTIARSIHYLEMKQSLSLLIESSSTAKAVVVSKCHHNFWTKHFQQNPQKLCVEIAMKSLTALTYKPSMWPHGSTIVELLWTCTAE